MMGWGWLGLVGCVCEGIDIIKPPEQGRAATAPVHCPHPRLCRRRRRRRSGPAAWLVRGLAGLVVLLPLPRPALART